MDKNCEKIPLQELDIELQAERTPKSAKSKNSFFVTANLILFFIGFFIYFFVDFGDSEVSKPQPQKSNKIKPIGLRLEPMLKPRPIQINETNTGDKNSQTTVQIQTKLKSTTPESTMPESKSPDSKSPESKSLEPTASELTTIPTSSENQRPATTSQTIPVETTKMAGSCESSWNEICEGTNSNGKEIYGKYPCGARVKYRMSRFKEELTDAKTKIFNECPTQCSFIKDAKCEKFIEDAV